MTDRPHATAHSADAYCFKRGSSSNRQLRLVVDLYLYLNAVLVCALILQGWTSMKSLYQILCDAYLSEPIIPNAKGDGGGLK